MSRRGSVKLEVDAVSRAFGDFSALHEVSLEIEEGSVLALLGPSGSGKSTLLKIIGGHDAPDAGDVRIDGRSVVGRPPNLIPTATVFQHYALFPHYSVFKNVAFGLKVRGDRAPDIRHRVAEVLDTVGMSGFEDRDVGTLSGGEKQRIAMARALAVEPEVMLLDEPLGALDRLIRVSMQQELGHLLPRLGVTTVYVTHDQHEAFSLADQVAIMSEGQVHQVGTPMQVYREPANKFVAHFVGGTNFVDGDVVDVRGASAVIDIGEGTHLVCRVTPNTTVHEGERVTAMIRPEDVRLESPVSERSISGSISDVDYMDDFTNYTLRLLSGHVLVTKQLGKPTLAVGAGTRVIWDEGAPLILAG